MLVIMIENNNDKPYNNDTNNNHKTNINGNNIHSIK